MLISDSKLAANRRNAPLSKGAMSADGKAAVKHNALRHGLTSKQVVLPQEDADAYTALREDLIRDHAPANSQELDLVDQIAQNYWRLLRAQRVETELFDSCLNPTAPRQMTWETREIRKPFAQAFTNKAKHFDSIRRYLTSIERAYYKAIEMLRKLQLDRTKAEQVKKLGTVSQKSTVAAAAPVSCLPTPDSRVAPAPPAPRSSGDRNTQARNGDNVPVAS